MRKVTALVAMSAIGLLFLSACVTTMSRKSARTQPVLAEDVYLANNIHAQDEGRIYTASYANWTQCKRHRLLSVNTPVDIHQWAEGFVILGVGEDRNSVFFEYNPRNMKLTRDEYVEEITAPEKIDLSDLSETDREGIRKGKAEVGMTKKGVKIALGYPAQHETPRLDDDIWTYWTNKWGTYDVIFDDGGKVKEIRE